MYSENPLRQELDLDNQIAIYERNHGKIKTLPILTEGAKTKMAKESAKAFETKMKRIAKQQQKEREFKKQK